MRGAEKIVVRGVFCSEFTEDDTINSTIVILHLHINSTGKMIKHARILGEMNQCLHISYHYKFPLVTYIAAISTLARSMKILFVRLYRIQNCLYRNSYCIK